MLPFHHQLSSIPSFYHRGFQLPGGFDGDEKLEDKRRMKTEDKGFGRHMYLPDSFQACTGYHISECIVIRRRLNGTFFHVVLLFVVYVESEGIRRLLGEFVSIDITTRVQLENAFM